jgi:hypothetical protein
MFRYKIYFPLLLMFVLHINFSAFAQNTSFPYDDWAKKLNERNDTLNRNSEQIYTLFWEIDTARVFPALAALSKRAEHAGPYFQVRFKQLQAAKLHDLLYCCIHILQLYVPVLLSQDYYECTQAFAP